MSPVNRQGVVEFVFAMFLWQLPVSDGLVFIVMMFIVATTLLATTLALIATITGLRILQGLGLRPVWELRWQAAFFRTKSSTAAVLQTWPSVSLSHELNRVVDKSSAHSRTAY